MSDAVSSPDANKKPGDNAEQAATDPQDAEASKNAGGATDASKEDSSNPADK